MRFEEDAWDGFGENGVSKSAMVEEGLLGVLEEGSHAGDKACESVEVVVIECDGVMSASKSSVGSSDEDFVIWTCASCCSTSRQSKGFQTCNR